jgi:hypothetical protein
MLMDIRSTDRTAIRAVIEQQLQAFQNDDAEAAFRFASPEIQVKFGTAETFLRMVRTTYSAVYRPRSVLFAEVISLQNIPTQEVILLDPDGNLVKALYLMEQQPGNDWRICGCFVVPIANPS